MKPNTVTVTFKVLITGWGDVKTLEVSNDTVTLFFGDGSSPLFFARIAGIKNKLAELQKSTHGYVYKGISVQEPIAPAVIAQVAMCNDVIKKCVHDITGKNKPRGNRERIITESLEKIIFYLAVPHQVLPEVEAIRPSGNAVLLWKNMAENSRRLVKVLAESPLAGTRSRRLSRNINR
ncbi:MAG TPA: hypothetical protein VG982_00320 [Candidatus Paceibacterota bacterium]|jgi:hypothetical protein|nr:hypothetical protein [Candidatus Paceibacterota bacterium]